MGFRLQPSTSKSRKKLFESILLNKTNKVSKISDNSVLSGVSYGVAKTIGKAEKDIFLALAQLFPDTAFSSQLDNVASIYGIAPRLGATNSSTYIRISAAPGTQYLQSVHIFESDSGQQFTLDSDVTVGSFGYTYAKVRSISTGEITNVLPGTITKVSPTPSGHIGVVNEYMATGGRDVESDEDFRKRIVTGANTLTLGTIEKITQVFQKINPNVLRVIYYGVSPNGKNRLGVVSVSGIDFTNSELQELLDNSIEYFSLSDLPPYGSTSYGVQLENISWQPIDLSFRVRLSSSISPDDIRQQIQVGISKYLDLRYFNPNKQKVEWDELLRIVKNTKGVEYVPDEYFYPNTDIQVSREKLPRLRGFLMLDLEGNIIQNQQNAFSPTYYPNKVDFKFSASILRDL